MKIGVIVHSHTGNTYSVAMRLKDKLASRGHSVIIERLKIVGEWKPGVKNFDFEKLPKLDAYEALVFGSPVEAFSLSPVMASYLSKINPILNKKAICFMTQFFPFTWMGGNRAMGQMKKICEGKGAQVLGTGIVNWTGGNRENRINRVVDYLSGLL